MPRRAYSDQERAQIRQSLLDAAVNCIAQKGLVHTSIEELCRQVGISKSFFYGFFSSKEELVLEALRHQQPKLLQYARQLMEDERITWRQAVHTFLKRCCCGQKNGVAVLSLEEEQAVYRCLSAENFQAFQRDQLLFFEALLRVFGVSPEKVDPRLFGNLALSMMMVYRGMPCTMPFLFPELAGEMVEFQIQALLAGMEQARDQTAALK